MPYRNKQMLRDANGDLIPQYWDVAEQEFKPLTGSDGANDVRLTGSKLIHQFPFNEDIDPLTSLEIISAVDISHYVKIVISFNFSSEAERFWSLNGRLIVTASRDDSLFTGAFITDRILLTKENGINRPYPDDPLRGAYITDELTVTGQYLSVEMENPSESFFRELRTVTLIGVY